MEACERRAEGVCCLRALYTLEINQVVISLHIHIHSFERVFLLPQEAAEFLSFFLFSALHQRHSHFLHLCALLPQEAVGVLASCSLL